MWGIATSSGVATHGWANRERPFVSAVQSSDFKLSAALDCAFQSRASGSREGLSRRGSGGPTPVAPGRTDEAGESVPPMPSEGFASQLAGKNARVDRPICRHQATSMATRRARTQDNKTQGAGKPGLSRRTALALGGATAFMALAGAEALRPTWASAAVTWYYPFTARAQLGDGFGMRFHPIYKEDRMHNGQDYQPAGGTPIYAIAAGVVSFAGESPGYGNLVRIDHADGYQSGYAHMRNGSIAVANGTPVKAGTLLGLVGRTGGSTGDHLHLEIRVGGTFRDPHPFVANAPLATGRPVESGPVTPLGFQTALHVNNGRLWAVGEINRQDWGVALMPGTSPSIAKVVGGYQMAAQLADGNLWTGGALGNKTWGLGMRQGTNPAITALARGGFQVAVQTNGGVLWSVGDAGNTNWGVGMQDGTSPAITAFGNGYQIVVQANTGNLWQVGDAGNKAWELGMMRGTSPDITAVDGGIEIAVQANTGDLWTVGDAYEKAWPLGMDPQSSPSITTLGDGRFEVAVQANTGNLTTVGAVDKTWPVGMMRGTSPAITSVPRGFEVAAHVNTGSLWTVGDTVDQNWDTGLRAGTSPAIA